MARLTCPKRVKFWRGGKIVRFRFSVTKHPSYLFVSAGKLERVHFFVQGKKGVCVLRVWNMGQFSPRDWEGRRYCVRTKAVSRKKCRTKNEKREVHFSSSVSFLFPASPPLKKALVLTQHIASIGETGVLGLTFREKRSHLRRFPQEKEKENALKKAPPFVSFSRLRRRWPKLKASFPFDRFFPSLSVIGESAPVGHSKKSLYILLRAGE